MQNNQKDQELKLQASNENLGEHQLLQLQNQISPSLSPDNKQNALQQIEICVDDNVIKKISPTDPDLKKIEIIGAGKVNQKYLMKLAQRQDQSLGTSAPPDLSNVNISDDILRRQFMKKVLTIVVLMCSFTIIVCVAVINSQKAKDWMNDKYVWVFPILFVEMAFMVMIYCFKDLCKKVPINYIVIIGFLCCQAYILAFLTQQLTPHSVLVALGVTGIAVTVMCIYAFTTKTDVTYKMTVIGFLPIMVIVIILFSLKFQSKIMSAIWSLLISLLFCIFLVYDLQKLRGQFLIEYTIDDYIVAAMTIYLDVVLIFKYILFVVGVAQEGQNAVAS